MAEEPNAAEPPTRYRLWKLAWFVLAAAYAWPVASTAYERTLEVTRQQRAQLIVRHSLWELHPEYAGTPQAWTRFASRLLSDRQLMIRVRAKYGDLADQIELDYRRDLFIAQAEVVLVAGAVWGLPLAVLYGIGIAAPRARRRIVAPADAERDASDSRYRK
ncbi:MAG: hypothetical protein HYU76_06890 [Betaproteobacteria bacterium]|nr:hypothetical protein [Betaproteobacteria bacterium]